jgi:DNA-3-methyladenine glycosylase
MSIRYGISYMLNVAREKPGIGARILISALEPPEGAPIMRANRGIERLRGLAQGPGRLTRSLHRISYG